jgi:peptide/nickel transport system permease protein
MMIPVLLSVTFFVFIIVNLTPGDIARTILGAEAPQSAVETLRDKMGLNESLIKRYFMYVRDILLKGDFGNSYRSATAVLPQVAQRFPVSFRLSLCAITFAVLVGIPLGVISAIRQYSLMDNIFTVIGLFFASVPPFWFGLMLIYFFSIRLGLLPPNGLNTAFSYILPTLTIGIPAAARLMRLTRSSMLETVRADYVRTARAKGLPERRVIVRHALKNALLPIITQVGMNFGLLFGECAISETVFVIPGCGTLILTAVKSKDVPLTTGTILWLSVTFCIVMLIVDLLYAFVDPRIKAKYKGMAR